MLNFKENEEQRLSGLHNVTLTVPEHRFCAGCNPLCLSIFNTAVNLCGITSLCELKVLAYFEIELDNNNNEPETRCAQVDNIVSLTDW